MVHERPPWWLAPDRHFPDLKLLRGRPTIVQVGKGCPETIPYFFMVDCSFAASG